MIVFNENVAGMRVSCPDGSIAVFDNRGYAEVDDACGLNLVRGYQVVSGTPTAVVTDDNAVRRPDGPLVQIFCPDWMAGKSVSCPDGRTQVTFSTQGVGSGPNTCGLDQVPGYRFGELLVPPQPVQMAPIQAAPAVVEAPAVTATAPAAPAEEEKKPETTAVVTETRPRGRPRGSGKNAALAAAEAAAG